MQATITAAFIEGIPFPIRQRLKLRPGVVMDFDEEAPYLKAVPAGHPVEPRSDLLADMMACIGIGKGKGRLRDLTSAEWLESTRGPVELPPEA